MIMHHDYDTKFVYKRFDSWEDMVQMKIQWNFEPLLWLWPWAQNLNAIFSQDNTACDDALSNQSSAAKGSAAQMKYQKVIFWLHEPLMWPWPRRQQCNIFICHSGSWWCITVASLVTNGSVVQKISSGQIFIDILKFHCDLDLEQSIPVFFFNTTLRLTIKSNKTKFSCKRLRSSKDIVETVVFRSYEPSLWPCP